VPSRPERIASVSQFQEGRPHEGAGRLPLSVPQQRRAAQTNRRGVLRSGNSLWPRRRAPAAGAEHARSRSDHRQPPGARVHTAAWYPAGTPQYRWRRRVGDQSVGNFR